MSEKILFYLNNLNLREKVLLFIATLLLGAFLGFKMSQSVLEAFFDYDLLALNEQKRQAQDAKSLHTLTQRQKLELDELKNFLSHFNAQHKAYLDEIYALANKENITFTSIKNSTNKDKLLNIHSSFIEFESGFYSCLAFLQGIEHSPLFFEFKELKLTKNEETKKLKAFIHLRFVSIK